MGFFDKLKKITTNLFSGFTEADEAFFEELEETLILADLGMDTALEAVEQLQLDAKVEKIENLVEIVKLGVMTAPSLMKDGKLIVSGQVLPVDKIVKLLQQ